MSKSVTLLPQQALKISDTYLASGFFSQFKNPSSIPIYEHAAKHFMVSDKSNAIPGFFNVEITPYLKEIMECLHFKSGVQEVVFQKSAQIGGTSVTLAFLLWMMETEQKSPSLVVFPTEKTSQRFVKTKLRPAMRNCNALQKKLSQSERMRQTLEMVDGPSGPLGFGNSNAPNTLRMDSCRVVVFDEVSDYPFDTGQGDAVEIGRGRTTTYSDRKKIYLVSTPNIDTTCRITSAYEDSDKRKYFVPCPHCNFMQVLKFEQLKWSKDFEDIHYECVSCKGKIKEQMKPWMLERGKWKPTAEDRYGGTKAGFQINGLYSPLGLSWRAVIQQYIASRDHPHLHQVWTNNVMGEAYKDAVDVSYSELRARVADYSIERLPRGVDLVTCGVDFNEHFTNYEYVGWGENFQSWGIEYGKIDKHISDPTLWTDLKKLLFRTFTHYKGKQIRVLCSVLDSGYSADAVWNFCGKLQGRGRYIIAIKGFEGFGDRIISSKPSFSKKTNLPFYRLSSHTSNETLFSWLNVKNKKSAGYCNFPKSYLETEYFEELTAMAKVKTNKRGKPVGRWVQDPNRRCEANDCRRMAIAGFFHLMHMGHDFEKHFKVFKEFDMDEVKKEIKKI